MDAPDNATIRARSTVLAAAFPTGTGDDGLTALIAEASGVVSMLTGRMIGVPAGEGPFGCPLEEVPDPLKPLATRVVRMRAERMDLMETDAELLTERAEQMLGNLASISAGPWSESYFPPGAQAANILALDPDPELAAELWALATLCAREGWERFWHPELFGLEPAATTVGLPWFPNEPFGPYRDPWGGFT